MNALIKAAPTALTTISEPEWLTRSLNALEDDYLRPKITASLALNSEQRSFVASLVDKIRARLSECDLERSIRAGG